MRAIVDAIGSGTSLPVRSIGEDEVDHFYGWMAPFAALDMSASNEWMRERLGWARTGPGLLAKLAKMDYADAGAPWPGWWPSPDGNHDRRSIRTGGPVPRSTMPDMRRVMVVGA